VTAFNSTDYALVARDAGTGAQLASHDFAESDFPSDIVVSHGAVIVASDDGVTALAPRG
jgi:hypothetical protein